jgi:fatty-acyl-CoA synthase
VRVEDTITVRSRPSAIWEVIGDPRTYTEVIHGVTRWEPVRGPGATGVGARYAMRMRVGGVDVGGEVEIVEYDACADLAWTGVTGIEQRGRWRVREVEPGVSTVTLRIAYQSPGGLSGLIADQVSGREVRGNVQRTLDALADRLEGTDASDDSVLGGGPISLIAQQARAAAVLLGAGVIRPIRPDRLLAAGLELRRWGLSLPGAYAAVAAVAPDTVAIIDEAGELSYADLERRTNALASGFAAAGIAPGERAGVLARNHRGIVEASIALAKLGVDVLFLNTAFAAPQIAGVVKSEDIAAIVHDEEFSSVVEGAIPAGRRFLSWTDHPRTSRPTLERLIRKGDGQEPPDIDRTGRLTILTSGTTGKPKGASRGQPRSADPAVAILSRIPLRARETTLIASPLFHSWGLAHLGLGVLLSSTLVLQRRFDAEATLAAIERDGVTALAAVPVMLQQILDLPEATRRRYDTSTLRIVAVSGSALPAELAARFMDEFGDVLYNLYGSTEVAWATIATPEDLREAPGTAGRPPAGTVVRILDDGGRELPAGSTGRIFVANEMLFEGYTGGGGKDTVDGMLASGDLGRFDDAGRLFIEGREDDMLVSGGENVFPAEIEESLREHRDIVDAAVAGTADERWGQRITAFVVKRKGSRLDADAVRDHVRSRLARFKVPRDVVFVDALPRNATGKVVTRELAALHADGARPSRRIARKAATTAKRARTPRRAPSRS